MNMQQIKGNWKQVVGKVKQQWGSLTDDDLTQAEGNVDQLVGKIQSKTGLGREEIERMLDRWASEGTSTSQAAGSQTRRGDGGYRQPAQGSGASLSDTANRIQHGVRDAYEATTHAAREGLEAIQGSQFGRVADECTDFTRRHPGQGIGIAFAAGLLVGLWLFR